MQTNKQTDKRLEITTLYVCLNKYVKGRIKLFHIFYSQLIVKRGTANHS